MQNSEHSMSLQHKSKVVVYVRVTYTMYVHHNMQCKEPSSQLLLEYLLHYFFAGLHLSMRTCMLLDTLAVPGHDIALPASSRLVSASLFCCSASVKATSTSDALSFTGDAGLALAAALGLGEVAFFLGVAVLAACFLPGRAVS